MNYWLNLFTGTTWREFQQAGATVSGFRERNKARAQRIKPGDSFLCYIVGVKRWVGLLEVDGAVFHDENRIFSEEIFPIRFHVKPLVMLPPEHGVPMEMLKGKLTFFPDNYNGAQWSGHVRGSPAHYKNVDGDMIAAAIHEAERSPVNRPVDQKKLARSTNLYKVRVKEGNSEIERVVSIPSAEPEEATEDIPVKGEPSHSEIQWRLLDLCSQMGLEIWAPKRDRGRAWNRRQISNITGLRDRLPPQFDENTNRTIEEIDVLWLNGQSIVAAFEVEHSTSIFSGLLRMSDLLTMQPNITIKLYIVGPDDRYTKFEAEVARPTFAARSKPLHSLCRFLPYSKLCERLEEAKNVIRFLRPEFLDEIAELYDPEVELDA